MAKRDIAAALKKRAEESAADVVQNERFVDEVYQAIIGGTDASNPKKVQRKCLVIPVDKLRNFFTAQIGFRAYCQSDLEALAEDIQENGLLEYGIARPIPGTDEYEILSGRNRKDACVLLGWELIPFHVAVCEDARAIIIATATNLKRRQRLMHSERGWAYRALLEAQRCQGKRVDLAVDGTSVETQQKTTTRDKVAEVFGIKPHEVQRDIRLTYLIQPLLDAVDEKRLKIGCGTVLAGYDEAAQRVFLDLWQRKVTLPPNLKGQLKRTSPPPSLSADALHAAWEAAEKAAKYSKPPATLMISFARERFEPVISRLGGETELERLFLEFLESHVAE